jgi:hypothetical protein
MDVKPTHEIIDEALNRPWDIEEDLASSFYPDFREAHRRKLRPLIILTETIDRIVPGFILQLLARNEAGHSGTSGHELDPALLEKKIQERNERILEHLEIRKLLIELTREELELEDSTSLDGLEEHQLRTIYDQALRYNLSMDLQLDFIYRRLARASGKLPGFIIGKLAQMALTPFLCARITEHLPPAQAGPLARHFPDDFLSEVSLYLDADRIAPIAGYIKERTLRSVIQLMLRKHYFRNLGEINDNLERSLSLRLATELKNPGDIARVFSFMNNIELMNEIFSSYGAGQKEEVRQSLAELDPPKAQMLK